MPIVKHLIAETFGTHIGKYQGRLKITKKGEVLAKAPLLHLDAVHVMSAGVSVSSDALAACCERGIPIFFVDSQGVAYASVYAAGLSGTVLTRREQLRAYDDARGITLAVQFAHGKIRNQARTLHYMARTRKDDPAGQELLLCADEVLDCSRDLDALQVCYLAEMRATIMGIEAQAAARYWQAIRAIIPQAYGWERRTTRGAIDPVNSLLNYGYGILYGQVERALVLAGLDPFAGYLHADRPGKPSLTLDMVEEFRQVVVDRVVFGLLNRQFKIAQDEKNLLTDTTRRGFAEHILNHLETRVRYGQERVILRVVIQRQARHLAAFLRGEYDHYTPYKVEV